MTTTPFYSNSTASKDNIVTTREDMDNTDLEAILALTLNKTLKIGSVEVSGDTLNIYFKGEVKPFSLYGSQAFEDLAKNSKIFDYNMQSLVGKTFQVSMTDQYLIPVNGGKN